MPAKSPVPEGFSTVTPHLVVNGASDAIEFYQKAFGAEELSRMAGPRGTLMHALLRIGSSRVMLCDDLSRERNAAPAADAVSPVTLHLFVEDADQTFERAVAAGAKVVMPLEDMFWGDRYGTLEDPFGHRWAVATRKEDLSHEEVLMRAPTMEA